jgi:hypothetical protein
VGLGHHLSIIAPNRKNSRARDASDASRALVSFCLFFIYLYFTNDFFLLRLHIYGCHSATVTTMDYYYHCQYFVQPPRNPSHLTTTTATPTHPHQRGTNTYSSMERRREQWKTRRGQGARDESSKSRARRLSLK